MATKACRASTMPIVWLHGASHSIQTMRIFSLGHLELLHGQVKGQSTSADYPDAIAVSLPTRLKRMAPVRLVFQLVNGESPILCRLL